MKTLSVYEGKNKFSQVITNAENGEHQFITKNGRKAAVVISYTDYEQHFGHKESLSDFLLNSPWRGAEIDLTRSKDMGRPTLDFSDSEDE